MHTRDGTDGIPAAAAPVGSLSDWRASYPEGETGRVQIQTMPFIDISTMDRRVLLMNHPDYPEDDVPVEVVALVFADGSTWPE